jgi:hypothetical protein
MVYLPLCPDCAHMIVPYIGKEIYINTRPPRVDKWKVMDLRRSKMTVVEIAKKLGCSQPNVSRIAKLFGDDYLRKCGRRKKS